PVSFIVREPRLQFSPSRRDAANTKDCRRARLKRGMEAMAVAGLIGTEEERTARRLIEQMGTILTRRHDDMPAGFAAALFGRAAAEALLAYEPRELAALAEEAWAFLSERKPGAPHMRFDSRPGPVGAERIKTVSVLEIVNDDMP